MNIDRIRDERLTEDEKMEFIADYFNAKIGNLSIVHISQSDYDALATKDANTLYVITGA